MVERVQTGGVVSFEHKSQGDLKLDPKRKKDISEAYEKYYVRREEERKNRIIFWIGIILLIFIGLFTIWFFWR